MSESAENESKIPVPVGGWMTAEEYDAWVQEPGNSHALHKWVREGCQNPESPPAHIHRALHIGIQMHRMAIILSSAESKLNEVIELLRDKEITGAEWVNRAEATFKEVTDMFLELHEPHRTTFLNWLLPKRAELPRMLRDLESSR